MSGTLSVRICSGFVGYYFSRRWYRADAEVLSIAGGSMLAASYWHSLRYRASGCCKSSRSSRGILFSSKFGPRLSLLEHSFQCQAFHKHGGHMNWGFPAMRGTFRAPRSTCMCPFLDLESGADLPRSRAGSRTPKSLGFD